MQKYEIISNVLYKVRKKMLEWFIDVVLSVGWSCSVHRFAVLPYYRFNCCFITSDILF